MSSSPVLSSLGRVLVPLACAGCGRPDHVLCPACRRDLAGVPSVVDTLPVVPRGAGRTMDEGAGVPRQVPVHSLAPYTGRARRTVLAWKSGGRRDLGPYLAEVGQAAGLALTGPLAESLHRAARGAREANAPHAAHTEHETLVVVPAPSGRARRWRGALVVLDLADAVASGLARGFSGRAPDGARAHGREQAPVQRVCVVDLLVRRDGSQAGRDQRRRSRRDVAARAPLPPGTPVVLVDDVLTTGATLAACARAVTNAGGEVMGALTLVDAGRGTTEVHSEH